jgi:FKBP-type peptidyl-prolyl cis-trans isomerase
MRRRLQRWLVAALLTVAFASLGWHSAAADSSPIEPLPPAPPPPAPPAPADVAAAPGDAKTTASGLAFKVLFKGKGAMHPGPHDRVTVQYSGWTSDGKLFDSSITRGEPSVLSLDGVIKGWVEGLQLMVKGEKRRFWIPADLGYGDAPSNPNLPAGALVFDVELIDFVKVIAPPQVPDDLEAPPKDAKRTASGLVYKILKRGKSKNHPTADNTVEVQYSGWTSDGKLFDSSVTRGQPATFPLDGVIKGWTEGLQLLAVGDKARFWIPGYLAYGEKPSQPGSPAGTLVFDVELLAIR